MAKLTHLPFKLSFECIFLRCNNMLATCRPHQLDQFYNQSIFQDISGVNQPLGSSLPFLPFYALLPLRPLIPEIEFGTL